MIEREVSQYSMLFLIAKFLVPKIKVIFRQAVENGYHYNSVLQYLFDFCYGFNVYTYVNFGFLFGK